MLAAFATPKHRRVTFVLLATACLAGVATLVIGLDGNRPALLLATVSAIALVLAFVHPWRRARDFQYLFYASGLGFGVFVLLHNLLDAGSLATAGGGPLQAMLHGLSVGAFLVAVFLCPPAMIIGLAGALIMFLRNPAGGKREPIGR